MPEYNKINGVAPKDAETKSERMLLGYLEKKSREIVFGTITMEMVVKNGVIAFVRSKEVDQTFECEGRA